MLFRILFQFISVPTVFLCRCLPNWQHLKDELDSATMSSSTISEEDMRALNSKESSILTSNLSSTESLIPQQDLISNQEGFLLRVKMAYRLGVIGGSGFSQFSEFEVVEELTIETDYGLPSDKLFVGQLGEMEIVFLPRHGRSHWIPPHKINFRANLVGFKKWKSMRLFL